MTLFESIVARLAEANGVVVVATPLRVTYYYPKHAGLFVAGKEGELGCYVRQGRKTVYLLPSVVKFGYMVPKK